MNLNSAFTAIPEIADLLAAARRLGPALRGATYEALFGLITSTGVRVSEAVHLQDGDVDLKSGMLTVRQTKFAKSRVLFWHRRIRADVCARLAAGPGYHTASQAPGARGVLILLAKIGQAF